MGDESPKCRTCGAELQGRDVYEGLCKTCREEAILGAPLSAKARKAPTQQPPPPRHAERVLPPDAIAIESAAVDHEADTKEIALNEAAAAAPASAPPASPAAEPLPLPELEEVLEEDPRARPGPARIEPEPAPPVPPPPGVAHRPPTATPPPVAQPEPSHMAKEAPRKKVSPDERALLVSDTGELVLTTHRLRLEAHGLGWHRLTSVMLEELCSCETRYASHPVLFGLALLSLLAIGGVALGFRDLWDATILAAALVVPVGFAIAYWLTRKRVLSFASAGGTISVRADRMSSEEARHFIEAVERAKNARYQLLASRSPRDGTPG